MKLLHTLVEGGQTWAHRIRMVKQVLKMALSLSILSMLIYFAYSFSHLDSLILQSGYYHLKADIYSHFSLKGVPVLGTLLYPSEGFERVFCDMVNSWRYY